MLAVNLEGFFFTKTPLISKVRAAVRGLNELEIVGFVRKVVLFSFCLFGCAEGEIQLEYLLLR